MKKKVLLAAVFVLVLAGALRWVLRSRATAAPEKPTALGSVERKTLEIQVEAPGLLEPVRVVEVKSRAAGEVLKAQVETGATVEQGVLLAEIDPRDVENALLQAKADVEAARVHAQTAEANRKRMEALKASKVVTVQEYESANEAAATARSALVRAETNLELARERRGDVTIRAPIAGTVIERTVEPGQIIASATGNVSGGTTLFKMADLSAIQVRLKVNELDIGQVQAGQVAQVTVGAYPNRKFAGEVLKVEPLAVVEQNVTMFPVLVRLENKEGLLRPGMTAEVSVQIARRQDAVVVPNASLVSPREAQSAAATLGLSAEAVKSSLQRTGEQRQGRGSGRAERPEGASRFAVVFVKSAEGTAARRVALGLSDWEHTEVVKGLEPGEQVVLISVAKLQQKQQQATDRMRQQAGNPLGGGAGGPGRGRGG